MDDNYAASDNGTLDDWSISIDTAGSTTTTPGELTDDITISDVNTVDSMSVAVNITHPDASSLTIKLESPDGTESHCATRQEQAPTYPDLHPSDFDAESTDGTWTLTVIDNDSGDSGTLDDWSLSIGAAGSTTTTPGKCQTPSQYPTSTPSTPCQSQSTSPILTNPNSR